MVEGNGTGGFRCEGNMPMAHCLMGPGTWCLGTSCGGHGTIFFQALQHCTQLFAGICVSLITLM